MRLVKGTVVSIVLGGLVLLTAPRSEAQDAFLYEVMEVVKTRPGSTRREATAAIVGTVKKGTAVCPAHFAEWLGVDSCGFVATASDNVDLKTGKGPITGNFKIVMNSANTNAVDGAEQVVLEGSLQAAMDLSPAFLGVDGNINTQEDSLPLGSMSGFYTGQGTVGGPLRGHIVGGNFTGTFRLPFVPMEGAPPHYMLDPGSATTPPTVVPVQPNEYSLGVPTVRVELIFSK